MAFFPARIEGLGASNSCRISPMTQAEGERWREGTFPLAGVHPRPSTHSLTQCPFLRHMPNQCGEYARFVFEAM